VSFSVASCCSGEVDAQQGPQLTRSSAPEGDTRFHTGRMSCRLAKVPDHGICRFHTGIHTRQSRISSSSLRNPCVVVVLIVTLHCDANALWNYCRDVSPRRVCAQCPYRARKRAPNHMTVAAKRAIWKQFLREVTLLNVSERDGLVYSAVQDQEQITRIRSTSRGCLQGRFTRFYSTLTVTL
jgi:hypothetical protein